MLLGIFIVYGTLGVVTAVGVAVNGGGSGNYDPYTDDPSF